jgi:hypothetical protein
VIDIDHARLLRVTWSRASKPAIESDVWQFGLIVYELVTNAARHAFNGRAGKNVIELECTDGLARCKVTGNAFASSNVRSGQGQKSSGSRPTISAGQCSFVWIERIDVNAGLSYKRKATPMSRAAGGDDDDGFLLRQRRRVCDSVRVLP